MKNCRKLTGNTCPVCGCRKIRLVTEDVMRLDLPVKVQTGVIVLDMPILTIDLVDNEFEPRVMPAVCNNAECGGEDGPCHFSVVMNPQAGEYKVYVRNGPHERRAIRHKQRKGQK